MANLRAHGITLLLLLAAGCGGRSSEPTISPLASARSERYEAGVDMEVARIFGNPPLTGELPSSPAWSPDGQHLAFLRKTTDDFGQPRSELWIHTLTGDRERPVIADKELSVSWFAWAGGFRLVYAVAGDLHLVGLDGTDRQLTETEPAETNVQVTADGSRIAFVREHDVYAIDLTSGAETRLTRDGSAARSYGEVTWVYGEEFGTESGLGWSPDGARLWIYATDETEVNHRIVLADSDGGTREQAYPQPGQSNPVVRVGVVDFSGGGASRTRWLATGNDPDVYLPQVTWHPDGKRLLVTRVDRLQTLIELLLCDAGTAECAVAFEERDPRWVNLLGPPEFVGEGDTFLWLSERSGYAHILRVALDGSSAKPLTDGEWVVASIAAVDEQGDAVYFTGNPETPVTYGVYRVALDGGRIHRISPEGGVHSPLFSPDHTSYADTHSSLDTPPRTDLFSSEGVRLATVRESDLLPYASNGVANDIFPIESKNGEVFWAHLTRPAALEPERRYPVLVHVYGGPHAQIVRDQFRSPLQGWRDMLARRGILVFSMDGRGSTGRGRAFETPIHLRLTQVELEDQLSGVKYLRSQPFVDPKRLAIFGWSYGGTMVLAALLRSNGAFRAGVAVAPVTDWTLYDTAYTERYMQRPTDNLEGYEATSLLPLAGELDAPLLLVHGLADDNVHFANTAKMIDAFIEAGKEIEVMVFPGKAHGIRGPEHRTWLFSKITHFIERHL